MIPYWWIKLCKASSIVISWQREAIPMHHERRKECVNFELHTRMEGVV